MAVPLQYQSQFVPTDFNTLGNVLGMFRQDMQQRNQEFDQGAMMKNKALAELYGTKTYDQDVINEQTNRLKQQIEDAVKRRGMDYGAASSDIAGLIAQEQSNPIWGLNTQKVKQTELLEQALARNPNLKVLKDPRTLALSKDMKAEDIGYSVLDPEEVRKAALNMTKHLDTKKLAGIRTDKSGYDVGVYNMGPSEQDLQALLSNSENIQQLKKMFPQIGDSKDLEDFLSSTLYDAGRSYQRQPEESILGFNPYIRERIQNENSQNPYATILPTAKVGAEGIQKVFPISESKDFWKLPQEDLTRKDIIADISLDKNFVENNKEELNTFGSVENAKNFLGVYSETAADLAKTLARQYGSRDAIGFNPNNVKNVSTLVANNKENREKFVKAQKLVNNFESKLSERLNKENEDLIANFEHYNVFTGIEKLDAVTQAKKERMQKFVKEDMDLTDLVFETSSNKDINFSDQINLAKKGNKDYLKASENGFEVVGVAIDPVQGVKVKVETKNADGGTTIHIASPASPEMEQQLVRAYTGGTDNNIWKKYKQYAYSKQGEQIVKNFNLAPEVTPQPGITIGEYKKDLESKIRNGSIEPETAKSVLYYLEVAGINDNVKL